MSREIVQTFAIWDDDQEIIHASTAPNGMTAIRVGNTTIYLNSTQARKFGSHVVNISDLQEGE